MIVQIHATCSVEKLLLHKPLRAGYDTLDVTDTLQWWAVTTYRKVVYGGVIILQMVHAELNEAKSMRLALWRRIILCKSKQSRQQPALPKVTVSFCVLQHDALARLDLLRAAT